MSFKLFIFFILIFNFIILYSNNGRSDDGGFVFVNADTNINNNNNQVNGKQQPLMSNTKINRDCSSELSKKVRAILDNIFYPIVLDNKYQLPDKCQLNPSLDMLAYLETQKINLYGNWKCRNCSKQFNSEDYLDLHLKSHHGNLIPTEATVCLGDFCEMLNCKDDLVMACDVKRMDKLKNYCQNIMYNCFPLNQEHSKSLHTHFTKNICDQLTCDGLKRNTQKLNEFNQNNNSWSLMKYIVAVVTLIIMVLFYLIVCFYRKETVLQKDLRRLSNKRHRDLLKQFDAKNH